MALLIWAKAQADDEENRGVDDAAPRRHRAVRGHAGGKGFTGGTDQREAGHRGAEHAHEQHEGTDGTAGHKEIFAGAAEKFTAENAEAKQ